MDLERAGAAGHRAAIREVLDAELRRVLGLDASVRIDPAQPFRDLGLTSLRGVEFSVSLDRALGALVGKPIEPTVVFDHPSLDKLLVYLAGGAAEPAQAAPRAAHAPITAMAAVQAEPADEDEPIAVVGLGCRFPGAPDPEAYWRLLSENRDAITEVPPERWDIDAFYDPDPAAPGKMSTRFGGFLRELERFDAAFFGISPREARSMDPQHRLLLEVSWEALEHAGIAADALAGSQSGVFVGLWSTDYAARALAGEAVDTYSVTGTMSSVAAGRLAYTLGLEGPCLTVDTACSSSLVAVHLACRSLRARECGLALAGGVNLVLEPAINVSLTKLRALSPTGRCHTFAASGDGYVRSEGCGVVVLKRLSDARAAGDRVLAVLRGSAINQDGRSSGLTAPSGTAQEAVLRQALAHARLTAADLDYVEAHGTGTPLGDPIEVQALARALGPGRDASAPLLIGSVKTNIGHTEGAAGVAGLIKLVLALGHELLPGNLHFDAPNPYIPWSRLPVAVVEANRPWPRGARPRRAGVSSFGMSGTNAHLIVEEAPSEPGAGRPSSRPERGHHLLLVSAKSEVALVEGAHALGQHLAAHPEQALADVAHTTLVGRASLDHRAAVVAASRERAADELARLSSGTRTHPNPKVAFLFTGQGAQYAHMGRRLYETQPVFRAALDDCAAALPLPKPLLSVLFPAPGDEGLIDRTEFTQPALVALQLALVALWRSWGVEPDVVIGHSIGEIAAAHVAGVMGREDALRLVAARGRFMQALPAGGGMLAVRAPLAEVRAWIEGTALAVAGINAPTQTVVSGALGALEALAVRLAARGVEAKPLPVSHAFHSPLMAPAAEQLERWLRGVSLSPPRLPLFTNVDGRLGGDELARPEYWSRQVLAPVDFAGGVTALGASGVSVMIEIGPRPTLLAQAEACGVQALALPSLRRDHDEELTLYKSLGRAWAHGLPVDRAAFDAGHRRQRVALPTYPFERQRHWIDRAEGARAGRRDRLPEASPLAGAPLATPRAAIHHVLPVGLEQQPYLADHKVHGEVVVPGAFHLAVIAAVARARLASASFALEGVEFVRALVIGTRAAELHVVMEEAPGGFRVEVSSDGPAGWQTHVTGALVPRPPAPLEVLDVEALRPAGAVLDAAWLDRTFTAHAVYWGPRWSWTRALTVGARDALTRLERPERVPASADPIPPALLDNAIATEIALTFRDEDPATSDGQPYVPYSIDAVRFHAPIDGAAWCYGRVEVGASGERGATDLRIADDAGAVCVELVGLRLRRAPRRAFLDRGREAEPHVLALAAEDAPQLAMVAARYADHLAAVPRLDLADLCATASGAAPVAPARAAVVGATAQQLRERLVEVARRPPSTPSSAPRVAFLFTGQGAQYAGMGRAVFEAHPTFRRIIERCSEALEGVLPRRLVDVLALDPREEDLRSTALMQPAIFALELALCELWRSWGVEPHAVLGHSLGEYAAATAAGLYSLEDAVSVVAARGQLLDRLPDLGAALSVRASLEVVQPVVAPHAARAAIAAINGPEQLLVTGAGEAITRIAGALEAQGVEAKLLSGAGAGHSPLMDPLLDALEAANGRLTPHELHLPFVSTLTGARVSDELAAPDYWRRHIREPVQFLAGMRALRDEGCDVFVEIGPRHTLLRLGQSCLPGYGRWLPSLSKERDGWAQLMESAAELYQLGGSVDWAAFHRPFHRRRAPLPLEPVAAAPRVHPRLGTVERTAGREQVYARAETDVLRLEGGALAAPGALLARALAAAGAQVEAARRGGVVLEAVALAPPRRASGGPSQLVVGPVEAGARAVRVAEERDGRWRVLLSARTSHAATAAAPAVGAPLAIAGTRLDPARIAARLGLARSPSLGVLRALTVDAAGGAEGSLAPGPASDALEAALYAAALTRSTREVWTAAGAARVWQGRERDAVAVRVWPAAEGALDVALLDAEGAPALVVQGLTLARVTREALARTAPIDWARALHGPTWIEAPLPPTEGAEQGAFVLTGAADALGRGVADELRALGEAVVVHERGALAEVLLRAAGTTGLRAVVVLAPSGRDDEGEATLRAALDAVQALAPLSASTGARLYVVTAGAVTTPGGPVRHPRQALAWGLGQVVAQELPALWGACIDVAEPSSAEAIAALTEEVWRGVHGEPRVALAGDRRWVARLEPWAAAPAPAIAAQATYVVTGGLGALGLAAARWLADQGAAHVVLLGRRAPSPEVTAAIAALEQGGATVTVASVDVTDAEAMASLFARLAADGERPVRGVIHAAGVLDDGLLAQQTWPRAAAVLAPKVRGAELLDRLTRGLPLDFFVLYGSVSTTLGNPGQGAYAAANAYLEALAERRRAEGLPALSIAWCPWEGEGMAAGLEDAFFRRWGVQSLEAEEGTALLGRLLGARAAQVVVMPVVWSQLARATALPPLLAAQAERRRAVEPVAAAPAPRATAVRREDIPARIRSMVAHVIGLDAGAALDVDRRLEEMGFDSLLSTDLVRALEGALAMKLPSTLIFDHPTTRRIIDYVLAERPGGPS